VVVVVVGCAVVLVLGGEVGCVGGGAVGVVLGVGVGVVLVFWGAGAVGCAVEAEGKNDITGICDFAVGVAVGGGDKMRRKPACQAEQ
jgi:hypothetical protein